MDTSLRDNCDAGLGHEDDVRLYHVFIRENHVYRGRERYSEIALLYVSADGFDKACDDLLVRWSGRRHHKEHPPKEFVPMCIFESDVATIGEAPSHLADLEGLMVRTALVHWPPSFADAWLHLVAIPVYDMSPRMSSLCPSYRSP